MIDVSIRDEITQQSFNIKIRGLNEKHCQETIDKKKEIICTC